MIKTLLKIVGISVIVFTVSEASNSKDKPLDLALAKRSLLEREKEFLKNQPISEDLKAFIERYKRRQQDKRQKRSQEFNENLYIVQNGQLVPLKTMKTIKRSDIDEQVNDVDSFTVVPLVIPLGPKQKPQSKLIKIRTLNEDALKAEPAVTSNPAGPANSLVSSLETSSLKPEEVGENGENPNDEKSLKEENEVLHKILQDVEGLMQWKHEGNRKEGVICNLNGSWISDAAGMRFDICYQNSTRKKFRIHVADRIPPNEDGFLCDGNWTLFGELPFLHSGLVIALAVHQKDKHIATFIGECRVCEGSETVSGTWLIGRSSRDCKDQKAAHKILSDVWRREQVHTLRKKHLEQLGYTVNSEGD